MARVDGRGNFGLERDPGFVDLSLTGSAENGPDSTGSFVGHARASAVSLGAEAYLGYVKGVDDYYAFAEAASATNVDVMGPANTSVDILIGSQIDGGLGAYGTDVRAEAEGHYDFRDESGILRSRLPDGSSSTDYLTFGSRTSLNASSVFHDVAKIPTNSSDPNNPDAVEYSYSPRHDFRTISIDLDGSGNAVFWMQLVLTTRVSEGGDEAPTIYAGAADYLSTLTGFLEPLTEGVTLTPRIDGWQVNPYGTTTDFSRVSPDPTTFDVSGIDSLPLSENIGDPMSSTTSVPAPRAPTLVLVAMLSMFLVRRTRQPTMQTE